MTEITVGSYYGWKWVDIKQGMIIPPMKTSQLIHSGWNRAKYVSDFVYGEDRYAHLDQCPCEDKMCGFYAFSTYESLNFRAPFQTFLLVQGKGNIYEHEWGWRAEYIKPLVLIVGGYSQDSFSIRRLKKNYPKLKIYTTDASRRRFGLFKMAPLAPFKTLPNIRNNDNHKLTVMPSEEMYI